MFSDLMLARYIFHAAHCETRQATTEQLSAPTYSGWTSFDHGYGYAGAKYVPIRFPPFARSPRSCWYCEVLKTTLCVVYRPPLHSVRTHRVDGVGICGVRSVFLVRMLDNDD